MTTLFPQVAVDLKFCRETVSLALHYLMRFGVEMSFQELSCQKFQLAAITSMFVASKIEEPRPLSIVSLSNTFICIHFFLRMSVDIWLSVHFFPPGISSVLLFQTKMIELSNSFFSAEDFLCMERLLLEKLGGLTTPPTPYHFLQGICDLKLIPVDCLELAEGFIDVFHHGKCTRSEASEISPDVRLVCI